MLGVQANIWTEHMPDARTSNTPHSRGWPRWPKCLVAGRHADWNGFLARLPAQFARYRARDLGDADSAFAPDIGSGSQCRH